MKSASPRQHQREQPFAATPVDVREILHGRTGLDEQRIDGRADHQPLRLGAPRRALLITNRGRLFTAQRLERGECRVQRRLLSLLLMFESERAGGERGRVEEFAAFHVHSLKKLPGQEASISR